MNRFGPNELLEAVDATHDPSLLDLDSRQVKAQRNDALQRLHLPRKKLIKFNQSLDAYRLVTSLDQILEGSYVRWITMRDDGREPNLTQGGHVCRVDIGNSVRILCRNKMNRMFSFDFNAALVFVRLTDSERLLLSALDHLAK